MAARPLFEPAMPITAPARRVAEAAVVLVAVAIGYFLLLSPIPVDDVGRYVNELGSDRFHWDLGHVWMQPIAMILYRTVLHGLTVMRALETINVVAFALCAAIFYDTLRRLDHGVVKAVLATAAVVLSYDMIVLVPTGHIKPMMLPVMALSIRHAVLWERDALAGKTDSAGTFWSGLWLGVASNLLVSVLSAAPFVGVFILWRSFQAGRAGLAAWKPALMFALGLAIGGAVLLLAAYATARASDTTTATGIRDFVFGGIREKEDLHVGFASWREVPFRFVFSLIFNFAFLPTLGSMGRAWLDGMIHDVGPHALSLLAQAVLAGVTAIGLATLSLLAARSAFTRREPLLLALGFVLGAATFSAYYNLNDPEHWFAFTMPFVLIAAQARRRWLDVLVFGIWLPVIAVVNLGLYGIPKATFDLAGREQALATALGPQGLEIGFAGYPGEPDSSLLGDGGAARFKIDLELAGPAHGNVDVMLQRLDDAIDATLAKGGRVLLFRAIDPDDWRGPVMAMSLAGMTKTRLHAHLEQRYRISGPIDAGGFPAWELTRGSP